LLAALRSKRKKKKSSMDIFVFRGEEEKEKVIRIREKKRASILIFARMSSRWPRKGPPPVRFGRGKTGSLKGEMA